MPRFLVAIADFITNPDLEQKILGDIADVVALNGFSETEVIDRLENAHAIAVWHNLSLTKSSIERLKCCKLIVRSGVGIDNVDYKFARTRGHSHVQHPGLRHRRCRRQRYRHGPVTYSRH